MRDTTTYDIFKEDLAGNPCWVESIEGLVAAVSEMEKLAANEPVRLFFVLCSNGKSRRAFASTPRRHVCELRTRQKSELKS
jgi:hypothetical protein